MNITSGKLASPQRGVFYGPEGVGKTTLAASLPLPVFIDLEDGTKSYDVQRAPHPATFDEMLLEIAELAKDARFQTIVVDTADAAERLACEQVLSENKNWKSISEPDYGKGFLKLADKWEKLLECLTLASKSKHIVIVAHSAAEKFTVPGQMGQFDRYMLKLTKVPGQTSRSMAPMLKEWADCVLFINFVSLTTKEDGTKRMVGIGGKERMIYTMHCDAYDAKHRHGLAEELPCEYASIARVFPVLTQSFKEEPKRVAAPAPKVETPAPKPEDTGTPKAEPTVAAEDPLAWFANYEAAINVKLLAKNWIVAGQTWRDLNESRKAQLNGTTKAKMANWCGFELKEGDK